MSDHPQILGKAEMTGDEWDGTWTLHMSKEAAEDAMAMQRMIGCQFFLMFHHLSTKPLTERQARIGWREIRHGDHRHKLAVGWRLKKQQEEAEAKREAEKAACPYVECTCGHHEDYA